jgi:hypothetical protein
MERAVSLSATKLSKSTPLRILRIWCALLKVINTPTLYTTGVWKNLSTHQLYFKVGVLMTYANLQVSPSTLVGTA